MREKRVLAIGLPALLAVIAILACNAPVKLTAPPEETVVAALLGDVLPDEDVVNHGRADGAISQLLNREILRDGDRLEILEGGVAEVLLVNAWQFYLFNKTRMGVELREGETIQETMLMESGTLLGRREIEGLQEGDEPVIFRLPGDRSIIVSGTRFFIVLGDDTNQAIVGNFDGSVRVEGGGVSLPLPAGEFIRDWGPFQPPDQATQGTITFTLNEFMDWGRVLEEPSGFREVVFKDETDVPTPTGTPTQIPSPTPSFTPTPTPSVTPTPTLGPPMVTGDSNANCRFGPGTVYDVIGSLLKSETALINGRNASTTWWWIQNPDAGGQCWVWDGLVTVSGDTGEVPVIAAPPLPATDTPTPTFTPTLTPTPCPKLTIASLSAVLIASTPNHVSVAWGSSGGCSPFSGTVTARYIVQGSPYASYPVTTQSGTLTDKPPLRCEGTFTIEYVLVLGDKSGQSVTIKNPFNITWIC